MKQLFALISNSLVFALLLLYSDTCEAKYYKFSYFTEDEIIKLSTVLRQFIKEEVPLNAHPQMIKKILSHNPHIKNWKQIQPQTKIILFLPHHIANEQNLKQYFITQKSKQGSEEKKLSTKKDQLGAAKEPFSYWYSAFYKIYTGPITGSYQIDNAKGEKLSANSTLSSLMGGGMKLHILHNASPPMQYTFGFIYSVNGSIKQMPASHNFNVSSQLSIPNFFWRLSPFVCLQYESLSALAPLVDSNFNATNPSMFKLYVLWLEIGAKYHLQLSKFTKMTFAPSIALSVGGSASSEENELITGASSGTKITFMGTLTYKTRYFAQGGLVTTSLSGDAGVDYKALELNLGMNF
ncbi:MAG: hypothetical protein ISR65_12410 [Bacteriovoracaceae bacterium]|nr:hypothetical protein [Bacteriovoracaceae bacterium]